MNTLIDAAIKYLSNHYCSEKELIRQLERDFSHVPELDAQIHATIARLRELHLINDNRLAESLSARYIHKGNRFIQQILKQKGVKEEVIEQVLEHIELEDVRALDEARKKMRGFKNDTDEAINTKLARFLSGRGFSHATIKTVLKQLREEQTT
ncbi:TPA: regulatory protein RecX [Legionella pneumophila]